MLGIGTKSSIVFVTLLCIWLSKKSQTHHDYRHKLPRFTEVNVDFDKPNFKDNNNLLKSVNEINTPVEADLSGQIPDWIIGTLLSNGPGLFEFKHQRADHVFDGMAMIRKYQVQSNKPAMNISRRLIKSDILQANLAEGRFTEYGIGTAPLQSTIFERFNWALGLQADNVVVTTVELFGHYYAAAEGPEIIEYDVETLETLGTVNLAIVIPGLKIMTPHPLYDEDGTLWNIGFAVGPDKTGKASSAWRYVIFKVSPPKTAEEFKNPWLKLEIVAEISSSRLFPISYFHSFFMTENFLIYAEQPWITGGEKFFYDYLVKAMPVGATMDWLKDDPLIFHVVEKATGKITPIKYEGDPMGFFHIINAYEADGFIILDAPFKPSAISYNTLLIDELIAPIDKLHENFMSNGPASGFARRWALPLDIPNFTGNIIQVKTPGETKAWVVDNSTFYLHPEYLAPPLQYKKQIAFEFCSVNPNFVSKKYRFAYGMGFPSGYLVGSIMKLDVYKKEFTEIWEDPNCRAGEPIFVPKPDSIEEEDGAIVFICHGNDPENPITSFVVLNSNLRELGRFSVPFNTPVGFHGIWKSQ